MHLTRFTRAIFLATVLPWSAAAQSRRLTIARWRFIAPLGRPVEPEVKIT